MPNSIAYLVLALWPLVMFVFFKRLPIGRALICSFLGAYLLLPPFPTAFDFPLLPPLTKMTLPNVTAVVLVIFVAKQRIQFWPQSKIMRAAMVVFLFSPIFTVLTNPEPILFASGGLRGLYAMDILALVVNQLIILTILVLARQFLATAADQKDLLLALCIAGCAYSFPMLLEIRLSPQLNIWIYGFFPHVFEQMMRGGGFRAIVFLAHGIWAAMFILMALTAAVALWKNGTTPKRHWFFIIAVFLAGVLVLNKTLGPVVYAGVMLVVILFTSWRNQLRIAALLGALALAYPAAKTLDLVPEEQMLALAAKANENREHSLRFRFESEAVLLERAAEKPLFGWGTWGRNHIHDPVSGAILSISDGHWVITLGVYGWFGFLAEFGLLTLPIFLLARQTASSIKQSAKRLHQRIQVEIPVSKPVEDRLIQDKTSPLIGPLCLLLALNVVDLLPNATLTPLTWLLAGALFGYAERLASRADDGIVPRRKSALEPSNRIDVNTDQHPLL